MSPRFRLNLFSKKPLQHRYLLLIIVAMVVPALVVGSFLYYFIFAVTAEQIGIPENIIGTLQPVVEKINVMLVAWLLPLFALLIVWGLILSHRFCGPIERIEADLDKILEGNYHVRFKVRKNDDIKHAVEDLNKVLDILESKCKEK